MDTARALQLPRRRFTVDEVLRMVDEGILGEDEHLELLDGDLLIVSPQDPPHASTGAELYGRLSVAYGDHGHVRAQLPLDLRPYNMPEPDLAVVPGIPRDYRERHPTGREALLVIEIAWTSHAYDRRKTRIYAAAGTPVCWLLDVAAKRLEVLSEPRPSGEYASRCVCEPGDEVALPGLDLRWRVADLFF